MKTAVSTGVQEYLMLKSDRMDTTREIDRHLSKSVSAIATSGVQSCTN